MTNYRYLLNIAYVGKPFRGAQRQATGVFPRIDDPLTVQGRIEMGLKTLNPVNEPVVTMSSRTDAGVHAINSTCHVGLHRENGIYEPRNVMICLNKYFHKKDVPIRIIRSCIVPETFHCGRNAISRTYLYRIVVAKADTLNRAPNLHYLPIEEWDRCLFLCTDAFDLDRMQKATKLLEGYHDFRTFMGKHSGSDEKITRKITDYIKINERSRTGYSSYSWPPCMLNNCDEYLFIDVYMKSKGFLYKQVRRTVATLVAVAQGKVTIRDIKFMLEIPSHRSWCPQIKTLPAHGLYLCKVEYSKEDLDTFRSFSEA